MGKIRRKFACDFETTTSLDDEGKVRVWAWAYMEIGNRDNWQIGTCMESFMEWCAKEQGDLYFHNLKFDGSFICNWLLHNGWECVEDKAEQPKQFTMTQSKMGQWYVLDLCYGRKKKKKLHTVIYDSLKKLPFPVKVIAKAFNLHIEKGDIDYHKERPVGYVLDENEIKYIKNDVEIVACALEMQFNQGLTKMTTGSDSLAGFKDIITKKKFDRLFPVLKKELDDNLRMAYKGGFTWLNEKFAGKVIRSGIVFDVNSLYPAQMYDRLLPYGVPLPYDGEYVEDSEYPLYIQHVRCSFFVRDGFIPTIQIKGDLRFKSTEYLNSSRTEIVDLYVTNVDLEMIKKHYHLRDVEYVSGWKFKGLQGVFKDFIDKWTLVKTTETGALKTLAKLMLNSLYGKFASNPDVSGKYPYLKEDGSTGFAVGKQEFKDPVYTPMGAFITAWARHTCISAAQMCYDRIIYCDTDSIHLTGTEIPDAIKDIVDDKKLGYWKFEYEFKKAKYIRQKTYLNVLENKETGKEELVVKCAGMTESVKKHVTFDNFQIGFTAPGKLLPKQVKGGVILQDTYFTMK